MNFEAWATVVVVTLWLALCGYLLAGLRDEEGLSKARVRSGTGEGPGCRVLAAAQTLGARIMSVVDAALARVIAARVGRDVELQSGEGG